MRGTPKQNSSSYRQSSLAHIEGGKPAAFAVRIVKKKACNLQRLVAHIAQALVDNPGAVKVAKVEGNRCTVLSLWVSKEDIGKIIGRNGRTVQAIRTLLCAVAAKEKTHAVLEIVE